MKRILYLSLLLVIPFFLHADQGRDRLNGKWISTYFGTQIRVKVKRHQIEIKGLDHYGWRAFLPVRIGLFEDCDGNTVKIKSIHNLTYRSRYGSQRIRFTKKGHQHASHVCSSSCSLEDDYFNYSHNDGYNNYNDGYDNDYEYNDYQSPYVFNNRNDRWNDNRRNDRNSRDRFSGNYYLREIDEYIEIKQTQQGLKARKSNKDWVRYSQNRFRKNEYLDERGNKYLVRNNGDLTWKNRKGNVSFNLTKNR